MPKCRGGLNACRPFGGSFRFVAESPRVWVEESAKRRVRNPIVPVAGLVAVLLLSSCGPKPTRNARSARARVPGVPTAVVATPSNFSATVAFRAPATNGGSAISGYTVTSSPGGLTATGSGSPISVTGLANRTSYTFTVTARNAVGISAAAAPSSAVALAPTRVLVTGDSVAMRLTLGLQDAAAKTGLQIISAVAVACGTDGQKKIVDSTGEWKQFAQVFANDGPCVPSDQLIEHYHPALVLWIDSGMWSSPAIFTGTYGDTFAKSLPPPAGTHFVWATVACPQQGYERPAALAVANDQVRQVAAQHPSEASIIDLAQLVCPDGAPLRGLGGVETLRTDGLHYNVAGSDLVGGWIDIQLNAIAHATNR